MMDVTGIDYFKEMIRREWTDDAIVAAWREWSTEFSVWLRQATEIIVEAAGVPLGAHVLDLASGTGEPALTLAEKVGPDGSVTATDLSSGMIAITEANAKARRCGNVWCRQADVHSLPFGDRTFDAVTCRFGVMYFADAPTALHEIWRVLKLRGRVALTAWASLNENEFLQIPLMPFLNRTEVPPPPIGAPQPFKYAEPGTLSADLAAAGFQDVDERRCALTLVFPGTPEENWQHIYDTAAPFRPIIESLSPSDLNKAVAEVLDGYRRCFDGQRVTTSGTMVLATATR
jgi:SAM-dependent methyltransferase